MGQQPGTFDPVTLVDLGGSVKFSGGGPYICLFRVTHLIFTANPLNVPGFCLLCPALLLYKVLAFAALMFATL